MESRYPVSNGGLNNISINLYTIITPPSAHRNNQTTIKSSINFPSFVGIVITNDCSVSEMIALL